MVTETLEELEYAIHAENDGGKATWLECFSERNMLWKRTINGMMLQFIQQLNGQNFYCEYMALPTTIENLRCYLDRRLLRRHVLQERGHNTIAIRDPDHSRSCIRCRHCSCTVPD